MRRITVVETRNYRFVRAGHLLLFFSNYMATNICTFPCSGSSTSRLLLLSIVIFSCVACTVSVYSLSNREDINIRRPHRYIRRRSLYHSDRFFDFKFLEEPKSSVAKNGRIELKCHAVIDQDDMSLSVEWRKDGVELSTLRPVGKVVVSSSGSLLIENAAPSDEGIYQCAVHARDKKNFVWTFLSRRAVVRFPSLSRFEVQPQDREIHAGQSVGFACVLDARPSARIDWYHNGKRITVGADESVVVFPMTSTLEITTVQARHEGTYHCVATNEGKTRTSREAQLRIQPENSVSNEFSEPYFVLEPRGGVVNEGDTIVLECLVNGWPRPNVKWLKGSETIIADDDRVRRLGSSSLMILKATPEDAGVYTCRASNSQESLDASSTIQVKVAPELTATPKNLIAQETTDVEFDCDASGKPGPTVSWYKNGETIIASEYFVIEATKLRVLGLVRNDQGVYQCIAENDAGSVQANAVLIVESSDSFSLAASSGQPKMPSEPLGVRASIVGSRFVTLMWDPPLQRHGAILSYHIFYKENGSTRERMMNSSMTSLTVTPLQPDTMYSFRIVAENEAGMGTSSTVVPVTTAKEKAVPGKVKNLKATALSPETIEVSWEPPAGNGPSPVQYKLFYIRKDHEPGEKETQIVMKKTSYTLHGMEKYVEYMIRVEAEGTNGAGLSSEQVTVRTFSDLPSEAPSDVRAEASSTTSIHVQWSPVPPEESNGIVTGYRIKYKTKVRGAKSNTLVVDGKDSSYTITGLEAGTQYMLRVAAVNQNGTGPNSEWLHVDTPLEDKDEGQVAGPPISLKVQPGSDSIRLSWVPPHDENIMIRGYLVGWGINIPDLEQVKVPANLREYTISSLKPGRDYVISLRAYNVMGYGFPIYETVRTTLVQSGANAHGQANEGISSSETPIGVRAFAMSASSIKVTWTDTELPYSRQYTVRYSSRAENGGHQRYVNTSEPEVVIEGLRPNTQYEFAVKVNAGKASSSWSMTAENSTLPAPPSSAPRDLTVVPPTNGDPHSLTLNWQPPKYANGEIEEYLVFYTDRANVPDKDWILDGVKGDRLSISLTNLLPRTTYFFKVQARNVKGYGPFSPTLQYVPGGPPPRLFHSMENPLEAKHGAILSTPIYLVITASVVVMFIILLIVLIWVARSKSSKKATASGYMRGHKHAGNGKAPPDLWINHTNDQLHGPDMSIEKQMVGVHRLSSNHMNQDQHIYMSPQMIQSAHDSGTLRHQTNARLDCVPAYAIVPHNALINDRSECNGTLTRSYHQSSTSLEGRQRTPQIVYTNTGRHQAAKIDFSDHGSTYSSSQALHSPTPPPPQLPVQGPPAGPPPGQIISSDGYRTLSIP